MNRQPQPDVDFTNQILGFEGKKTTDPFKLNRLKKVVMAYAKQNYSKGILILSEYYCYINEIDNAWAILYKAMRQFGYQDIFLVQLIKLAHNFGSAKDINKAWSLYINHNNLQDIPLELARMLSESCKKYVDLSILSELHIKADHEGIDIDHREINNILESLYQNEVSLRTYQEVMYLATYTIHCYYRIHCLSKKMIFGEDEILIYLAHKSFTDEDVIMMAQELDERILKIDDINFQLEADNIQVIFTNKNLDDIPEGFNPFEDEDKDLIELVKTRMTNEGDQNAVMIELT